MKYKNTIYYSILIFITLIGWWGVPSLTKKMTYTPDDYPFVYYSSILRELCFIDFTNKEKPMSDMSGNVYSVKQFDSLMPLFNFRQLMIDGKLPDSIDGHVIDPPVVRAKTVVYRHSPEQVSTPELGLYVMYESMPKRVELEMPNDVFRMKDHIEFIDIRENGIDAGKSNLFRQALEKQGYVFPSQWIAGNLNPRKAYDEGFFCLDANGALFHVKMVNGRPFVRNTGIGENIDIVHFSMTEVGDKRFYGFLFSRNGDVYIIESDEGKYKPVRLDIGTIDISRDELLIMGNLLYWTVSITTPSGKNCFALHTESLKQIQYTHLDRQPGKWDAFSKWLFPVYLTFESRNSDFITPRLHFTGMNGMVFNLLLASITGAFVITAKRQRGFGIIYILATGIAGLIALLALKGREQQTKE